MNTLDMDRLRALVRLNPATGLLHWVVDRPNGSKAGDVAGSPDGRRYVRMEIDGVRLTAHRVVWALHHGEWPPSDMQIDHINGCKQDNRPFNLRLANHSQNQASAKSRPGASGLRGVLLDRSSGRWRAKIMKGKKTLHLGFFDSKQEAFSAYCAAAIEL